MAMNTYQVPEHFAKRGVDEDTLYNATDRGILQFTELENDLIVSGWNRYDEPMATAPVFTFAASQITGMKTSLVHSKDRSVRKGKTILTFQEPVQPGRACEIYVITMDVVHHCQFRAALKKVMQT